MVGQGKRFGEKSAKEKKSMKEKGRTGVFYVATGKNTETKTPL